MAKAIRLDAVKSAFPEIKTERIIKRGSTSIIVEHDLYESMVTVYTTDYGKLKWFEEYKSRFGYRFVAESEIGSCYDELPEKVYKFVIKRMQGLTHKQRRFVNEEIILPFNSILGMKPNMKAFSLAQKTNDKKLKDMFFRLRSFLERNTVVFDLRLDSFMSMSDGSIVCVDPIYAKR